MRRKRRRQYDDRDLRRGVSRGRVLDDRAPRQTCGCESPPDDAGAKFEKLERLFTFEAISDVESDCGTMSLLDDLPGELEKVIGTLMVIGDFANADGSEHVAAALEILEAHVREILTDVESVAKRGELPARSRQKPSCPCRYR